ncbi:GntR family transcriptional regulator [Alteribacillus sp. JSM 102045]|uniref:GntR family transcriptional regulator n=1 Tax=Alteribacillus sp. JSM 102045 TaxID=1562101 RepID=UPI0035BF510B
MGVYESIKNAIIIGDYSSGYRLTEEALTKDWNVSRTPIREALKKLEFDGLITSLKRGFIVRTFSKEDLRQVYDLRALLESYAAGQAALNRKAEDIEVIHEANHEYEKALGQGNKDIDRNKAIVEANRRFHDGVVRASRNEHVRDLIDKVVVLPLVFRSFYWFGEADLQQSFQMHQTIAQAIEEKDADRAKTAMHEHIFRGRDYVLHHYEGGTDHDPSL